MKLADYGRRAFLLLRKIFLIFFKMGVSFLGQNRAVGKCRVYSYMNIENWIPIHQIRSLHEGNLSWTCKYAMISIWREREHLYRSKPDCHRRWPLQVQGIMILLYGAGGGPGRGETPMDPDRNWASDDFPVRGVRGKIAHTYLSVKGKKNKERRERFEWM